MVVLISGATHSGKTVMAQRLLEKYKWPYLSLDHLKMGLIRSGSTDLTVYDDDRLTAYLWPITREIIKTVIENDQNLIVEGCYIPHDWKKDFEPWYLEKIQARWLIMSEDYIRREFGAIRNFACAVERRLDESTPDMEELIREHRENLRLCLENGCEYIYIDDEYPQTV